MKYYAPLLLAILSLLTASAPRAYASAGTIDSTYHHAWSNNGGWVNWKAPNGNVTISDSSLSGYIWGANFGWINLAPALGGVTNSDGTLGGWAWGANTGWISFVGVTIDSGGVFHGQTVAQDIFGVMTFDCTYCAVESSWRVAASGRSSGGLYSEASQTQADAITVPSLTPTTEPPAIEPTTKPPTSTKDASYISQTLSASSSGVIHVDKPGAAPTTTPDTEECSWFGSCLWHSVVSWIASISHAPWALLQRLLAYIAGTL